MLNLYRRGTIIYCLKYFVRLRKRSWCFPSQIPNRPFCIRYTKIIYNILVFFAYIDARFCLYGKIFIIEACNRFILFVHILNIFFVRIKYIAFTSIPINLSNLSDTISTDAHVHHKADNRNTHNPSKLFLQIFPQGRVQQTQGHKLSD